MPTLHQLTLALLTSITLAACGGGGGTNPASTDNSNPTAITQVDETSNSTAITKVDATDMISFAKYDAIRELDESLAFSEYGNFLAIGTESNSANFPNSIPCSSGFMVLSYNKAQSTTGLTIGDTLTITFNQCADINLSTFTNGQVTLRALQTTSIDIPSISGGAPWLNNFNLPFSLTFTGFTQQKGANIISRSGTLNYSIFTIDSTFNKSMKITSNNYVIDTLLSSGETVNLAFNNKSTSISYRFFNPNSTLKPYQMISTYGLTAKDGTDPTVHTSSFSYNITGNYGYSMPVDTAVYKVTDSSGGKVTGTLMSPNVTIDIDEGNDGTVENSFPIAWLAL